MSTLVEQQNELKFRRKFYYYLLHLNNLNLPILIFVSSYDTLLKPSFDFWWIFLFASIVSFGSLFLIGLYKMIKNPYVLILDSKGIVNKTRGGLLYSEKVAWKSIDKIEYGKRNAKLFIGISLKERKEDDQGSSSKGIIRARKSNEKHFGYPVVIHLNMIKGEKENLLDEILAYQQKVSS